MTKTKMQRMRSAKVAAARHALRSEGWATALRHNVLEGTYTHMTIGKVAMAQHMPVEEVAQALKGSGRYATMAQNNVLDPVRYARFFANSRSIAEIRAEEKDHTMQMRISPSLSGDAELFRRPQHLRYELDQTLLVQNVKPIENKMVIPTTEPKDEQALAAERLLTFGPFHDLGPKAALFKNTPFASPLKEGQKSPRTPTATYIKTIQYEYMTRLDLTNVQIAERYGYHPNTVRMAVRAAAPWAKGFLPVPERPSWIAIAAGINPRITVQQYLQRYGTVEDRLAWGVPDNAAEAEKATGLSPSDVQRIRHLYMTRRDLKPQHIGDMYKISDSQVTDAVMGRGAFTDYTPLPIRVPAFTNGSTAPITVEEYYAKYSMAQALGGRRAKPELPAATSEPEKPQERAETPAVALPAPEIPLALSAPLASEGQAAALLGQVFGLLGPEKLGYIKVDELQKLHSLMEQAATALGLLIDTMGELSEFTSQLKMKG